MTFYALIDGTPILFSILIIYGAVKDTYTIQDKICTFSLQHFSAMSLTKWVIYVGRLY